LLPHAVERRSDLICGRYAPSPTGPLHLGNLRTALLSWLQVRLNNGIFILRMEDLDRPRVREGSAAQIVEDLRWLGLDWDEGPDAGGIAGPYVQSQRTETYAQALEMLRAQGDIYPCFCSRKDIQRAASAPHLDDGAPLYPGTCRGLSPADAQRLQAKQERLPAWRYRVGDQVIGFCDQVMGHSTQMLGESVGDFVVQRNDGITAYQLAVVVDDALMGVTDVVRGADLLDSTPRQIALYQALGHAPPRFWHVPLLRDEDGARMAKRDGSASLARLRTTGAHAADVVGYLAASLGIVPDPSPLSARDLLRIMDVNRFQNTLRQQATVQDARQ